MLYHMMAYQIIVGRGVPAESVLREKPPIMRSATSVAKRIVVMVAVRLRLEKIDDLVFDVFLEDPLADHTKTSAPFDVPLSPA
jgi:hypothetical protein